MNLLDEVDVPLLRLVPSFFHTADCYGFCPKLLRLHGQCLCIPSIHISSASSSVSWRLLLPSSSQKRLLCFRWVYSQMLQRGLWTGQENYKPQNARTKIPLTTSHMNYSSATLDHFEMHFLFSRSLSFPLLLLYFHCNVLKCMMHTRFHLPPHLHKFITVN